MGVLLTTRQVRKVMASYVGENKEFERQVLAGELDLELIPQGTLAERLRAGGAGIPGFYTRTGFATKLTEGKETKKFGDCDYVLEPGITAELSIVKAWKGDKSGNLIYRKTSRNFNPMIATCGKICVAEVEQLVEIGELDPDQIHTPGIFVNRIIQGAKYEKRIEFRSWLKKDGAARFAQWKKEGVFVNHQVLFSTFGATSTFDAAIILDFAHYTDSARWKEVEKNFPGGLTDEALKLAAPESTSYADALAHEVSANRDPSKSVYLLTFYEVIADAPKYKKYALAVEKCLTTFDNVHEWADFISFLTKLLKACIYMLLWDSNIDASNGY